ncbi:hypothetical protein [Flavobacterium soli]|uniref:hypothetical protein n=1 Tax=Flavobacterium soli TaxID=344881 RepID=UPI000405198D|nr:hypothetical protein [Flavobacterium soli]
MKAINLKIVTYLFVVLFAGYATTSCESCDDGNNFEDQEATLVTDTLSVQE